MGDWTKEKYENFRQELFAQAEETYRDFNAKLLCSDLPVIGMRVPFLRKTAKEIAKKMGISEANVKKIDHRAKLKLRALCEKEGIL